jgi:hypothetical protein
MKDIAFTQYLRPHGKTREMTIQRPDDIAATAQWVIDHGGAFTAEELSNSVISMACEFEDEDIAMELCNNGPEVLGAVDKLVEQSRKFSARWTNLWNRAGRKYRRR